MKYNSEANIYGTTKQIKEGVFINNAKMITTTFRIFLMNVGQEKKRRPIKKSHRNFHVTAEINYRRKVI
jgi:hypothetical protein